MSEVTLNGAEWREESITRAERRERWLRKNSFELTILFVLIAATTLLATARFVEVSRSQTLEWDSASFLTNGAIYAGYSQYFQAYDPTRPPFIPFLLSFMFALTGPNAVDGYFVSVVFYFLAIIGCYLIAREIMSPLLALMAALSYGGAPTVLKWSGLLVSNIEGVAVGSLAFATLILAANKNKKFLLISIPLLALTPLTKYSMASILIVFVAYLLTSRKQDWIFDKFEFYYGFALSIPVFAVVGFQWFSYPFLTHKTLAVLFPSANATASPQDVLGQGFYAINMPLALGVQNYGYLLLVLFSIALLYAMGKLLANGGNRPSGVVYALIAWFLTLFVYYSFVWPTADLRYSVEFIFPVIILAYWALSVIVKPLYSGSRSRTTLAITVVVTVLLVSSVGYAALQSGAYAVRTTPVLESDLNGGMRQAASWLDANVPSNTRLESNWYTLLWWYAPQYNTTAAPLGTELESGQNYITWTNELAKDHVGYVVYVNPEQTHFLAGKTPVWRSTQGDVAIYRVNSGL